ncbi:MAG: hypothetical protein WA913_08550 [Pricia sp.]
MNDSKHWFWQTAKLTYMAHSTTRSKAAIDASFLQGFPGTTLVRD